MRIASLDTLNFMRYGVNAPRYAQRIYVDPRDIDLVLSPGRIGRAHTGSVMGGDWDVRVEPLEASVKFEYCRRHFVEGLTWDEAGAYAYMREQMRVDLGHDGCYTEADVARRYEDLDRTFKKVEQERRLRVRSEIAHGSLRERWGVYVHFDRHGRPVFGGGGYHRLAIAKLTGLEVIPAQLGVVHLQAIGLWRKSLVASSAPAGLTVGTAWLRGLRSHEAPSVIASTPEAPRIDPNDANSQTGGSTMSLMASRSSEPSV